MPVQIKYPVSRKPLDKSRRDYVETLLDFLESVKITPAVTAFTQSLVYLILNDKFHNDITELRKKSKIQDTGLVVKRPVTYSRLYDNAQSFVESSTYCSKPLRPFVTKIFVDYSLLVTPDSLWLKGVEESHNRYLSIVGGFDVPDPIFGKDNTKNFDALFWQIYVYPKDNLMQVRKSLSHYFVWMMSYFVKEGFDKETFELQNRKVITKWNKYIKKPVTLQVREDRKAERVLLEFQSYINTKTKDILRTFDMKKKSIASLQKTLGDEPDNRAPNFRARILYYIEYLEGKSPKAIAIAIHSGLLKPTKAYVKPAELALIISTENSSSPTSLNVRELRQTVKRKVSMSYGRALSL